MKKIYYNGNILTLEENKKVESVMIEDGIITYVGDFDKIKKEDAKFIDLKGKTLMPSFIDPHSHIAAFTSTLLIADLSGVKSYEELIERLKKYKEENNFEEGKWLIGFGYDHNELEEKRHPSKEILDKISTKIPIMITHKSGHMGVINSKGIEIAKIEEKVKDFKQGTYGIDEKGNLNGYLEEGSFIGILGNTNRFSIEDLEKAYKKAEEIYLSYGITTVQDGLTKKDEFNLLKKLSIENKLRLDVVSYIDIKDNSQILEENRKYLEYQNNLKIGGYKLILDGSPQGKTAWLSKPYENEEKYLGYPAYSDEEVEKFVKKAVDEKVQLLTHCNGDAASEQLIESYEKIKEENLYRPVMIHAQTVRKDQIEKMKKLSMIPSFFIAHIYYWGDTHIKNLGKRAQNISPVKWSIDENIKYTFHQDTPVLLPNMWETIWCACKRQTKNGVILGNQQISVIDAIKGVTKMAAYQYFEEDKKGTIATGKNADFIIIEENPLEIDIDKIKDIKILETIKNGKTLYKRKEGK